MDKLKAGAFTLGINLTQKQTDAFGAYYRDLVEWNRKINLTAITGYEEVQTKHFLDSLTAVMAFNFNPPDKALNVIDVGTGAGFPGIPLKIAFPEIRLTLLEATAKKANFLQNIVRGLKLQNVEILAGRAEEIARDSRYREKYDVVLSRAVASLPALVELTLPLCIIGGVAIYYKKGDILKELEQAEKAVKIMGGRLKELVPVNSELFDDSRCLVVVEKVIPTPLDYPRRPGIPEKRPLLP